MRWFAVGAFVLGSVATGGAAGQALAPYDLPKPGPEFNINALSDFAFDAGKALKTERREGEGLWARRDGAVDRLKLTLGGAMRGADGLPVFRPDENAAFEPKGFDISLTRDWPSAVQIDTGGRKNVAITPHAGLALTDAGGGAQAGATVSLEDKVADRLKGLGVKDGQSFGDKGRWYLFAATSGKSVGLNMLRGPEGDLQRAGWSVDGASALVSDAQAGVGWRRGPMQASLGYLRREIKPRHGLMGVENKEDDVVAFTFSFKPR